MHNLPTLNKALITYLWGHVYSTENVQLAWLGKGRNVAQPKMQMFQNKICTIILLHTVLYMTVSTTSCGQVDDDMGF